MASSSSASLEPQEKKPESDSEDGPECSVCLQTCVLPTRLPCKHVFCFLCAKGLALQSQRCAMCRAEIPQDFLERPELLQPIAGPTGKAGDAEASQEEFPDKTHSWFYEGRNGWWQYETRLSSELEAAYQNGDRSYDALIAGSIYTLDFNNWMQSRKDDPTRRRRIKRDLATSQHKGVAGLRQFASCPGDLGAPLTVQQVLAGHTTTQPTTQAMHVPQTRVTRGLAGGSRARRTSDSSSSSSSASPASSPDGIPRLHMRPPPPRQPVTSQGQQQGASRRVAATNAVTPIVRLLRATGLSAESSLRQRPTPSTRVSEQALPSQATWMNPTSRARPRSNQRRTTMMTTVMTATPVPINDTSSSSEDDHVS